ncbi:MAG: hypothetical protein IPK59_09115 [Rhodospirillaceae bacterium]|nr:hypothetical protein [Rhodospirillaceae bacterium]
MVWLHPCVAFHLETHFFYIIPRSEGWLSMRQCRVRLAFLTLFVGIALLDATRSSACTILPLTPEQIESVANDTLRDTEIIAEGTVSSSADVSARLAECRDFWAEGTKRCDKGNNVGNDPFCNDFVDKFLEQCQVSGAVNVAFTNVLKGRVGDNAVVMYDSEGVCGGGITLAPGDSGMLCGHYDAGGGFQATWCDPRLADASGRIEVFDRYSKQRKEVMSAVEANPKDLAARTRLAGFLENWHDFEPGLDAYAAIREMAPQDPTGFAGAGRVLFKQERYADAVPYLQQAFDRDPANKDNAALLQRARTLAQQ